MNILIVFLNIYIIHRLDGIMNVIDIDTGSD